MEYGGSGDRLGPYASNQTPDPPDARHRGPRAAGRGERLTGGGFNDALDFDSFAPGTQSVIATIDDPVAVIVDAEEGDDVIRAQTPAARLVADGNLGDDQLFGGPLRDRITGGGGDDVADGGAEVDQAFLGEGDDSYLWGGASDGPDAIHGDGGDDTVTMRGSPSTPARATTGSTPGPSPTA